MRSDAAKRIIDANANRAREALRVMEDVARFGLDEQSLVAGIKTLRHELVSTLRRLPADAWSGRDVAGDVGGDLQTRQELSRQSLSDVAIAASKRAGEAMRVLEEMAKLSEPSLALSIKKQRYQVYDLEKRLMDGLTRPAATQWPVCVLISESLCLRPWEDVVRSCIEGGVGCLQLREKTLTDRELLRRGRRLIELARPHGVCVIVNDRADLALACEADGVHLGWDDLSVEDVRRFAGSKLLIGLSTHDPSEAQQAVDLSVDYCGVGSIFSTALKPDRVPCGPAGVSRFVNTHPHMPHLAIGGITTENVGEVVAAGARGVAVCGVVCGAADPAAVVSELASAMAARPMSDTLGA